jgi:hypothetical protein
MSEILDDEEDDFSLPAGDLEMDDNGGVVSAAAASRAAREAEAASVEAVNQKTNEKLSRHETRSAIPLGTAAKVGETFFGHLIEVLAGLTTLRGVLTRAAADASLALWALAWQPSNRRRMSGEEVIAPLVALYALEDARGGAAGAAAADDAGAVLGVLARLCERSRESIEYADPTPGKRPGEAPAGRQRSRITEIGGDRTRARKLSAFREKRFSPRSAGTRRDPGDERPGRASERVDVPKHPADHLGAASRRRHRARVAAQVRPSEARRGPFFFLTRKRDSFF